MNEELESFLTGSNDISFGYRSLDFSTPATLDEDQIGYAIDDKGNSLVDSKNGSWKKEWVVIGSDDTGDPIIVDISLASMPVLSASHGDGIWEPFLICDSFRSFVGVISHLKSLSINREYPDALEENPISIGEKQLFIEEVSRSNPESEIWYWEGFLEQEFDE